MWSKGDDRKAGRRGGCALAAAALGAFLFVGIQAAPAAADSNFERGFEDQLGRILAFEAVNLGKHVLFQGVVQPYRDVHYGHRGYRHDGYRGHRDYGHFVRYGDRHDRKHYGKKRHRGHRPKHDHWRDHDHDRDYYRDRHHRHRHDRHCKSRHRY